MRSFNVKSQQNVVQPTKRGESKSKMKKGRAQLFLVLLDFDTSLCATLFNYHFIFLCILR